MQSFTIHINPVLTIWIELTKLSILDVHATAGKCCPLLFKVFLLMNKVLKWHDMTCVVGGTTGPSSVAQENIPVTL